jgi:hypothetical protein
MNLYQFHMIRENRAFTAAMRALTVAAIGACAVAGTYIGAHNAVSPLYGLLCAVPAAVLGGMLGVLLAGLPSVTFANESELHQMRTHCRLAVIFTALTTAALVFAVLGAQ